MPDAWLSTKDAAIYAGVHPQTLFKALRSGSLPYPGKRKLTGKRGRVKGVPNLRFKTTHIDAWILGLQSK